MSAITKIFWVGVLIAVLGIGYGFLPAGVDHPLPVAFSSGIQSLYASLYSINMIYPVDTLVIVFVLQLLISIYAEVLFPFIFAIINWLGRIS